MSDSSRPARARSFEPHVLAVTNMYPTPGFPASGIFVQQQIEGLTRIGLKVDVMFVKRLEHGMAAYLGLRRRVRARLRNSGSDLVHAMYGGVMADQVTQAVGGRPVVVTFHGSDLLGEHSAGAVRELASRYGVRASLNAARRANGIVVVSAGLQDALSSDIDRSRIRIIPCGIDLQRFTPRSRPQCCEQLGWDPRRFHVLFPASADNPVKQSGLARKAVERANRLGIDAEMHHLSGVPNDQVAIWLNASDVVLLTSQHEGSPTIIKEALACDRPVVSVDVGDVGERINGVDGCFLASPDPDELAAKLHLVHRGPGRVDGRRSVEELSLQRVARHLREFYCDLVARNGKACCATH